MDVSAQQGEFLISGLLELALADSKVQGAPPFPVQWNLLVLWSPGLDISEVEHLFPTDAHTHTPAHASTQ